MSEKLDYTPPYSVQEFLTSEAFISLIVGPVGSTKTTAGIMKIAYHAKQMHPCKDGIRRSRCIWIRNTREQLRDTSIPDFLKWYPQGTAGDFLKTEYKFFLRFDDVECEVLFRGLDDSNDVRRLLSLQASFAVMDEFREINKDIFEAVQGRLGRYPDRMMLGTDRPCIKDDGTPNQHIWGMTNPPDMDTYWEEFLTNPPENADCYSQPSGLSPEADWVEFLPEGYYENLSKGKSEDWVDVYVHAKFGKSLSGKPVFRSFDKSIHVAKHPLTPNGVSTNPLIIGFDCTGLGPAAVIGQLGFEGRLYIYEAFAAEDMGALRFIREKLKPVLYNKYKGMGHMIMIDPAGMARGADERNVLDMLVAEQLNVRPARTNGISARIAAVEQFLTRMVDGKPGFVVDPECKQLITALQSKYRFKMKKNGEADDMPDKVRPWADLADALQYLCLHADGGSIFGTKMQAQRKPVQASPFRWAV